MKKLIFLFFLCFSLFISCKKANNTTFQKVNEDAIMTVMQLKTNSQIKNAYTLLNSNEKLELWNRHFEYFINSKDLTEEQISFITSFKTNWLKKDVFEKTSKTFKKFNQELPNIKYNSLVLFGVSDTYTLLFDLTAFKNKYLKQKIIGEQNRNTEKDAHNQNGQSGVFGPSNDCKCSKTDPYCSVGDCIDNGCNQSSFGCGTLWLFACNGVCVFV